MSSDGHGDGRHRRAGLSARIHGPCHGHGLRAGLRRHRPDLAARQCRRELHGHNRLRGEPRVRLSPPAAAGRNWGLRPRHPRARRRARVDDVRGRWPEDRQDLQRRRTGERGLPVRRGRHRVRERDEPHRRPRLQVEAKNAAGVSQYLGPCKTGATTASDSYAPTTTSGASDWTWVIHEWTSNTCASGPQSEDADNTLGFNVAQATAYTSSALTTTATTFPAGATAFVVVNGLTQGDNDWNTTWVAPGVSCANTASSDRPDSDANGKLPSNYLAYPPANTFADTWNKLSSYESATCPAFASGNAGQWKVTLTKGGDSVTLNVFSVDTTAPTVTINQASARPIQRLSRRSTTR